jgi:xylan 1,4-beta-xylosidase
MRGFWRGTREQSLRFYATAARALIEVHPDSPVGGPATAQNAWLDAFLDFSERRDVSFDFVSTHHYPTDATVKISSDSDIHLAHAQRGILREEALDAHREAVLSCL